MLRIKSLIGEIMYGWMRMAKCVSMDAIVQVINISNIGNIGRFSPKELHWYSMSHKLSIRVEEVR